MFNKKDLFKRKQCYADYTEAPDDYHAALQFIIDKFLSECADNNVTESLHVKVICTFDDQDVKDLFQTTIRDFPNYPSHTNARWTISRTR